MQTNDHKIRNFDAVLDQEFGAVGTTERIAAEQKARENLMKNIL